MGQITLYAAVANGAAKMPPGRDRKLLEQAAAFLDFRAGSDDDSCSVGANVIEFEDDDSTRQIGSICPHCKREPCTSNLRLIQFGSQEGAIPVAEFTCSGCRKILGFSILPLPPMTDPGPQRPSSGLILPDR